ncbi:MAG TPA: amino acid ABC transporter substrate-binding protein [Terriglobales bacterium]|nr:amino acid ABC transporter substrate-binding protein [Terriglobales bacterium]
MKVTGQSNFDRYRSRLGTLVFALLATIFLLHLLNIRGSAQTLDRIRNTGTLKLGYYADAGPFSYQDNDGKPAGYAIELCQGIAKDIKNKLNLPALNVEFVLVTGENRFETVQQGKIDLLCGPSVETLTRRKEVSYSLPIFPAGVGALMRADGPVQIRETLSGREPPYRPQWRGSISLALQKRTFSVVAGTTSVNWLNSKLDEFKIEGKVVPVQSPREGVERVLDRTSDVLFGERSILLDLKKHNPSGKDLIVLDRLFTYEPLAFALARNDEDFRLLVDQSLSDLNRSGETQSLYKQFFGEPDENTLAFFRLRTIGE